MNISGTKVAAAFVAARKGMESTVKKDANANYGKYATLAAVMEVVSEQLSANDLALVQEATLTDQGITVFTSLLHTSGEVITFEPLPLPLTQRTAQGVGSAMSYGRRYQLTAICGLAAEDDDGQEASQPKKQGAAITRSASTQTPVTQSTAPSTPVEKDADAPRKLGAATQAQKNELHAVGECEYPDWEAKRPKLVAGATKGKYTGIDDLTYAQANKLIEGVCHKLVARIEATIKQQGIALDELLISHNQPSLADASPVALTHIWKDVLNQTLVDKAA